MAKKKKKIVRRKPTTWDLVDVAARKAVAKYDSINKRLAFFDGFCSGWLACNTKKGKPRAK